MKTIERHRTPNDTAAELTWRGKKSLQGQRSAIGYWAVWALFVYGFLLGGLVAWGTKNTILAWLGW